MIRSRIRRILKHIKGYRPIENSPSSDDLYGQRLDSNEEAVAFFEDPYLVEASPMIFTTKRVLFNDLEKGFHAVWYEDLASVRNPENKESAHQVKLILKSGQSVTLEVHYGAGQIRPVYEFVRLFSRLITDVSKLK